MTPDEAARRLADAYDGREAAFEELRETAPGPIRRATHEAYWRHDRALREALAAYRQAKAPPAAPGAAGVGAGPTGAGA